MVLLHYLVGILPSVLLFGINGTVTCKFGPVCLVKPGWAPPASFERLPNPSHQCWRRNFVTQGLSLLSPSFSSVSDCLCTEGFHKIRFFLLFYRPSFHFFHLVSTGWFSYNRRLAFSLCRRYCGSVELTVRPLVECRQQVLAAWNSFLWRC